ncbi:MAG: SEC-C metal-binding domain-containing protein [Myxococcota bacterium]
MTTRPGRNDPCHCGSGKKYKKCHWDADEKTASEARAKAAQQNALGVVGEQMRELMAGAANPQELARDLDTIMGIMDQRSEEIAEVMEDLRALFDGGPLSDFRLDPTQVRHALVQHYASQPGDDVYERLSRTCHAARADLRTEETEQRLKLALTRVAQGSSSTGRQRRAALLGLLSVMNASADEGEPVLELVFAVQCEQEAARAPKVAEEALAAPENIFARVAADLPEHRPG